MSVPETNAKPTSVNWNPKPYTEPAKEMCNTSSDVTSAALNCGLKVGAKAAALVKPKLAPVLNNLDPVIDACTAKTNELYKKGTSNVIDKCFETDQSLGSRVVSRLNKQ